ncbi:MAG: hypothetical protein WDN69_21040 [Aliidongia sp.]
MALKPLRILLVFFYVTVGWLLFKLDSFADVLHYLARLIEFPPMSAAAASRTPIPCWCSRAWFSPTSSPRSSCRAACHRPGGRRAKPAILAAMLVFILFGSGDKNAFIYFQF